MKPKLSESAFRSSHRTWLLIWITERRRTLNFGRSIALRVITRSTTDTTSAPSLSSSDDFWCGAWGIIRAYDSDVDRLPRLDGVHHARALSGPPPREQMRRFEIIARPKRIVYRKGGEAGSIVDAFGLTYELVRWASPSGDWQEVPDTDPRPRDPVSLDKPNPQTPLFVVHKRARVVVRSSEPAIRLGTTLLRCTLMFGENGQA